MFCKATGRDEPQIVVRESEDGIYLKCKGCGAIRGYEIGLFADDYFKEAEG
jgi:translation initiation factor 2 beta subunit (eIF-2beta)/eIF-5